jgi:hypothetical protein
MTPENAASKGRISTRKAIRSKFPSRIEYYLDDDDSNVRSGMTVDVSTDGFSFWTETPIKPGQTVVLKNHTLPTGYRKAEIRWSKEEINWYYAGAMFIS